MPDYFTEKKMDLSVVIPAFNEEARIGLTLKKILNYLAGQPYQWEVIVVDDGSSDRTSQVILEVKKDFFSATSEDRLILLRNEKNLGKGSSVKKGVLSARGELVLFTDSDLSTPIEEIEKLLPWLDKGYEIAIGSRGPGAIIEQEQPFYRRKMGVCFNYLVRFLVNLPYHDTQCGFKLFRRQAAKLLFRLQRIERFSFDVEILYLAGRFGISVKEVPIRWRNSPASSVHPVKDSFRMLLDLFRLKVNEWRGYYRA